MILISLLGLKRKRKRKEQFINAIESVMQDLIDTILLGASRVRSIGAVSVSSSLPNIYIYIRSIWFVEVILSRLQLTPRVPVFHKCCRDIYLFKYLYYITKGRVTISFHDRSIELDQIRSVKRACLLDYVQYICPWRVISSSAFTGYCTTVRSMSVVISYSTVLWLTQITHSSGSFIRLISWVELNCCAQHYYCDRRRLSLVCLLSFGMNNVQ